MNRDLVGAAIMIVLALAVFIIVAIFHEPKEDCGAWRYTKQAPLMCKDWP